MTVFWLLLLGHILADFVFKPRSCGAFSSKKAFFRALFYFFILCLCSYEYLALPWFELWGFPLKGWQMLLLPSFVYFFALLAARGKDNLLFFISRQALSLCSLFLVSPMLAFGGNYKHYLYGPKWLVILNSCLIVSYVFSDFLISLYNTFESADGRKDFFDSRFLNMLLRLILFLLIVLSGWFGILSALILLGVLVNIRFIRDKGFYFYLGCFITFIFGILCKGIF